VEASTEVNWNKFVKNITSKYHEWVTPAGFDSVYRLTKSDMLACVSVTRGQTEKEIWLESEPIVKEVDLYRKEMFIAYNEVSEILKEMGAVVTIS
jgi:SSS family solute:Na+ symporter